MKKQTRFGIISTNRADLGILNSLLIEAGKRKKISCDLVLSGSAVSTTSSEQRKEILAQGIAIRDVPLSLKNDTKLDILEVFQEAVEKAKKEFLNQNYDGILITGDRFEMYAFAVAAFFLKIKVFHLHAGEETFGAIDNVFRHSITLFADVHFCSTQAYVKRVKKIKKDARYVYDVGAPSIDNLDSLKILSKCELEKSCGFNIDENTFLVTMHPETFSKNIDQDIVQFIKALEKLNLRYIVTASNVDEGGDMYNQALREFCAKKPKQRLFVPSLGKTRYFSALKYVRAMIGNSSSGIIEAASFNLPVVNIGGRQEGRFRTKNIIDCKLSSTAICNAVGLAMKRGKKKVSNPYLRKISASKIIMDKIIRLI